jgi:uncharacterized protein DUF3667
MSDEPAKILLGDTVISSMESRGIVRRFFGRRKNSPPPLTHCENCGTQLPGHYCPTCGQPAIDYRRSFRHVIADILDSFLSWDSKIFATFGLLLTRPWKLTNEFLAGHRVRYLNPLRLYLLVAVAFFFIVNYTERHAEKDHFEPIVMDNDDEAAVVPKPEATPPIDRPGDDFYDGKPHVSFFDDNPDRPKSAIELWFQQRIEEKIGRNGDKAKFFFHSIMENLPIMMLTCIPIFAFLLKILYFFRRIFYIDHLIYALHIHSFAYSVTLGIGAIGYALGRWLPALQPLIIFILVATVIVQILLSIRRVYRQGWFMTILKFFLGGFAYLLVLLIGLGATTFVTLALP